MVACRLPSDRYRNSKRFSRGQYKDKITLGYGQAGSVRSRLVELGMSRFLRFRV